LEAKPNPRATPQTQPEAQRHQPRLAPNDFCRARCAAVHGL